MDSLGNSLYKRSVDTHVGQDMAWEWKGSAGRSGRLNVVGTAQGLELKTTCVFVEPVDGPLANRATPEFLASKK